MLINCLAVGSGGFIGSVLRYLVGCIPVLTKGSVPFHTLLVNVLGAIFIGLIVGCSEKYISVDGELMLFLKVGLCSGFTTFSTFALESVGLIDSGRLATAILYIAASVLLCVVGIYLGRNLVVR